ncbi:MAG: DinB family protein [Planctomycetes bacterium]|nr:DinB family protein [Planctomycetota bacterium]
MQAKDVVKNALSTSLEILNMFLGDLSDKDMTVRPVPAANHIAWQLAHLIVAEKMLLGDQLPGVQYPEPPAAIVNLGSDRTGKVDPQGGYLPKAQYVEWLGKMRAATIAAVEKLSDKDLDKPTTNMMAKHAPTLGALLVLTANHTLMHGGQFTVVRRALNKPVVF